MSRLTRILLGDEPAVGVAPSAAISFEPEELRRTYLGALAAMTGPAWTLAPFAAFSLRNHAGVHAVWILFAGIAVAAAVAGAAAVHAAGAREA